MFINDDYYAILGVSPSSDEVVIKAAYKALLRKYHPDVNPSADASVQTAKLNAAFEVLGDADRRAAYDSTRFQGGTDRPQPSSEGEATNEGESRPPTAPIDSRPPCTQRNKPRRGAWLLCTVVIAAAGLCITLVAGKTVTPAGAAPSMNVPGIAKQAEIVPDVQSEDVRAGFADLQKTFKSGGELAVVDASRACHDQVASHPSWSSADQCAAFDLASAELARSLYVMGVAPDADAAARETEAASNEIYAFWTPVGFDAKTRLEQIKDDVHSLSTTSTLTLGDIVNTSTGR